MRRLSPSKGLKNFANTPTQTALAGECGKHILGSATYLAGSPQFKIEALLEFLPPLLLPAPTLYEVVVTIALEIPPVR
ncbi:unnamed protein product, partial [Iphiclides podalirius]